MRLSAARRHIKILLATTFPAACGLGVFELAAQEKAAPAASADVNAQAIVLDTIEVRGDASGTVGYLATRISTATKTDTPLINIPQSITVVTRQHIQDIGAQKLEDVVRYVPGVNWHQGENNRDQIVIRGQSST